MCYIKENDTDTHKRQIKLNYVMTFSRILFKFYNTDKTQNI